MKKFEPASGVSDRSGVQGSDRRWQQLQAIPPDLLDSVRQLPKSRALELARQIDKLWIRKLSWLVDYLQHCYSNSWQGKFSLGRSHCRRHRLYNS